MNHFSLSKPIDRGNENPPDSPSDCSTFSIDSKVIQTQLPLKCSVSGDEISVSSQRSNRGFWRNQLLKRFRQLQDANVQLVELLENQISISQVGADEQSNLKATVVVKDQDFFKRILLGGTIGSAESYIDGQWASDDLTTLIRIMIRNLDRFKKLEKGWAWLKNVRYLFHHRWRRNSIHGSRKNIRDHYDLGNDFYELFLDPTLNYSSGIFEPGRLAAGVPERQEMEAASIRKMDLVCRKLQLGPKDHVLEIGTGWGGLAIYMAQHYGCRVTTTTISKQQHAKALERVAAAGLSDQVSILLKDYRELSGKFNKIVSIEMIEAVGHQYYDEFFSCCTKLLTDDGAMLLQAITMGEQNFEYHKKHVDFIRKYVFPGGCLPSVTALASSVARVTEMRMLHQADISPHYVKTLQHWRLQFMSNLENVRELGYEDSFVRLWHFYLCYCEAAFAERRVHNVHLLFAKSQCTLDLSGGDPDVGL